MIDFHCHLDLYPNPQRVASLCHEAGVYVLSVTTTPSAWRGTSALAEKYSRIKTALGLHPEIAHERKNEVEIFSELLPQVKYVGEVGLDGSPALKQYTRIQRGVFESILKMISSSGGRIMSIHSRRAATEVLDLLEKYPDSGIPVLHWFSGSQRELTRAINIGCWFSVGPAMLRSKQGCELVKLMPRDRVLTESDGPFVNCGNKVCTPLDTSSLIYELSNIWFSKESEVSNQIIDNFKRLVSSF